MAMLYWSSDKYLISRDRDYRLSRVHRACYEAYHKEIPKGHVIHHIDRNRLNNDIDNLIALSPSEHSRLHNIEDRGKFNEIWSDDVLLTVEWIDGRILELRLD